ncbi:O-antigen ligase family protein [Flavobacteriaceae bacterium F89]|uniref:O-antigen ligase family protein n=1 Tax=Cerina litoralis TaxID=2874477 RepID=A0AAE3EXE4_9FLAO|nr:O-antigen ligase family protein [Cerina litoralis]MCG2461904.1 O-antigen ligase family protein [Cerina litoralis]
MKRIVIVFFIIPFIVSALNLQAFAGKFVSESMAQIVAYSNVLLIFIGIVLSIKNSRKIPYTIKLWFWFFAIYYSFGLIGNFLHYPDAPYVKTLVPIIYFIGFAFFLSYDKYLKLFSKTVAYTFLVSNLLLIYFERINFSMDVGGIYEYSLSRAGGVYGDANNAAVVCLLSFIFIHNVFDPINLLQKVLKTLGLVISLYALFLTFSNTGFIALLIVLGLTYHKFFNPKRIILLILFVPISGFLLIQTALNSPNLDRVQKNRIENVINVLTLRTDKVTLSERDILLKNMLNYVYENPFIGNGVYFSTDIRGHNTVIGVWADAGIFTFLFFLFVLFQYYKNAVLAQTKIRYFTLSILVVLSIFMLTLQTIINQPYLIVLFAYLSYTMVKDHLVEQVY